MGIFCRLDWKIVKSTNFNSGSFFVTLNLSSLLLNHVGVCCYSKWSLTRPEIKSLTETRVKSVAVVNKVLPVAPGRASESDAFLDSSGGGGTQRRNLYLKQFSN